MQNYKNRIYLILVSVLLFLISFLLWDVFDILPWWAGFVLYLVSALIVGYNVFFNAFSNIIHGRIFDENLLMAVASICAFAISEFAEGTLVLILSQLGELLQSIAVGKSRKEIASIMKLRPMTATRIRDGVEEEVLAEEVNIDDIILIRVGESVPLDCTIIEGETKLNLSSLTGESVPVSVKTGDKIISGSINLSSVIKAKVTANYNDSTIVKMLDLIEKASESKTKTEKFITRFAKIYTPCVFFIALFVAFICPIFSGYTDTFTLWLHRALVFLVISCPCALVISVPLAFFGGIGSASKMGVLVKGSQCLEKLAKVDMVAFDKTGTLTCGDFKIQEFKASCEKKHFFDIVCSIERYSNHPLSYAFENYAKEHDVDFLKVTDYSEIAGVGISAKIGNDVYKIGKKTQEYNVDFEANIFVTKNDQLFGYINVEDHLKDGAKVLIEALKTLKISDFAIISGDNEKVTKAVSEKLNITNIYHSLLPQEKVQVLQKLKVGHKSLLYMGDGINDAAALTTADVGVSLGNNGADLAIETSDVVISSGDITKLAPAIKLAKKTLKIARENIILSLTIKLLAMVLGICGFVSLWLAVFADVGVTLLAILNSSRLLKK